ncbi:ABC transporter substrate-binding protein [Gluconacetobacter takamatsuzukensis]|uniref:ABC transporter substrate-binding protein n=1 Tax=Gluconacetobacter takamatsuzukensis TaxID=1286190 RepID=A0A7W4PPU8_9PROT|nr:ABC transporter substrate-binding protein [Gluconacetobacter takamatsuzukensis]MBB2205825.1 ABC transporter substrate-binding protein [Gluconacetobacter takamatsuzukensis]
MSQNSPAPYPGRRHILAAALAALVGVATRPARAAASHRLRISAQESSILFQIARARNLLDQPLAAAGYTTEWSILGHSPAQMGQVDFLSDVAEAVPVSIHPFFPDLALYAAEGPSPHALGLLTRKDRNITSVGALRGRSVAVAKSGSSIDLLLLSLQQAGMTLSDIHPVYLPEAGSLQAFRNGSIDAWATFDPFFTFGRAFPEATVLRDGVAAGMQYNRYYMADRTYVRDNPATVDIIRKALTKAASWLNANKDEGARILSAHWQNMPLDIVAEVLRHRTFSLRPADATDISALEAIAATYAGAGLIAPGNDMKTLTLIK